MDTEDIQFQGHSVDHWFRVRTTGDDEARWEAIDAIRHLCAPDVSVPLLLETLVNDSYWKARALAAHAMYDLVWSADFRPSVTAAIPTLIDTLQDESREVCEQVIETFEALGSEATAALDSLQLIAREGDPKLAELANRAILAINS